MSACSTIVDDMKREVDEYNANSDAIPSSLKYMMCNERIHIIIDMNNGFALNLIVVTVDGKIVEFAEMEEGEEFELTLIISTGGTESP